MRPFQPATVVFLRAGYAMGMGYGAVAALYIIVSLQDLLNH
jgi:hypothetical protein